MSRLPDNSGQHSLKARRPGPSGPGLHILVAGAGLNLQLLGHEPPEHPTPARSRRRCRTGVEEVTSQVRVSAGSVAVIRR